MKRLSVFVILLLIAHFSHAQIPSYYNSIDFTKSGDSLKWQLATLVTNTHSNPLEYTSSTLQDTWDALKISDLADGSNTNILLVYGYNDTNSITQDDRTRHKDSSCHTSGCNGLWNREHVYPQSLSIPQMTTQFPGTGTDVHNLRAADGQANTARGNDMYDTGSGNATSLSSSTFYPGDEWKGDVARIIMYMYLRYDTECPAINVASGLTTYSPNGDMPNILLDWNAQDPPSQYEKNRNSLFNTIQGNRNPFIDNPYLATLIWNGPVASNSWLNLSVSSLELNSISVYPTVSSGTIHTSQSNPNKNLFYSLLNTTGQELQVGTLNSTMDISELSSGLYFLRISNSSYSIVHKIILR